MPKTARKEGHCRYPGQRRLDICKHMQWLTGRRRVQLSLERGCESDERQSRNAHAPAWQMTSQGEKVVGARGASAALAAEVMEATVSSNLW
jgi:hypothetical protein